MRSMLLAALLLGTASSLAAQWLDVAPHAGFTTFNMGDFNGSNDAIAGWGMRPYHQHLDNGFVAGLDFTTHRFIGSPNAAWGLRTEYLQSNLAEFKDPIQDLICFTDQATLGTALLGAELSAPLASEGLSLGLGAWAGVGHAVLNQHLTFYQAGAPAWAYPVQSGSFSADIPVAELEARATYRLTHAISLSFNAGWRWADAPQVSSGGQTLANNLQLWWYDTSTPVNVDFGGATAQGSANFSF